MVRGVWVEQTEDVLQSLGKADTVVVSRDAVEYVRYSGYRRAQAVNCSPIRRLSETGDRFVVFCGEKSEAHIAETRLEIEVSDGGRVAQITEVVARGTGTDGFFHWGRFGPP